MVVQQFTNLYGCKIGDNTRVGLFVEIQRGAQIGARLQDPEPCLHLHGCDDRRRRVRRARRRVRQRQVPAGDDGRRDCFGPRQTGSCSRLASKRRASIGSGAVDPGRPDDRCRGDRRGRSRGHAGRGAAVTRRWAIPRVIWPAGPIDLHSGCAGLRPAIASYRCRAASARRRAVSGSAAMSTRASASAESSPALKKRTSSSEKWARCVARSAAATGIRRATYSNSFEESARRWCRVGRFGMTPTEAPAIRSSTD